jgi:hypothetical protein
MRSLRVLAVAVLAVVLALSAVQNAFASTELAYDDNNHTAGTQVVGVAAVHFSLPSGWAGAILSGAEYYNPDIATVAKLHVSSGQGSGSDLVAPTSVTLTIKNGWNTFVLSVQVPADFYIAFEATSSSVPRLFVALATISAVNASRSFCGHAVGPWTPSCYGNKPSMIRALVDPIVTPSGPVGGFLEPVNKLAVFAPYLALFGVIGAVAVVFWKRPDN